jgi:hypothetical protein
MSIYLWVYDKIIKYIYLSHIPRFVKWYQGEICNIMQTKGMFFNYHGTWASIKIIRLQSTPSQQSSINFN